MPYILKANPDTTIIVSDFSPTVISDWKSLLPFSLLNVQGVIDVMKKD